MLNSYEGDGVRMSPELGGVPVVGETLVVMSDLITFRVTTAQSGGRLTVVEVEAPPGGGPPPMHTHVPDELFHVIEGDVTLYVGQPDAPSRTRLAVGESAHVGGGVPHTFRNAGHRPAKVLLVFSPGEPMERFFTAVGRPIDDRRRLPHVDLETEVPRAFEIGARLGMQLLGPPHEQP
jgi:quercetin dioxygenase-like cupin family protein